MCFFSLTLLRVLIYFLNLNIFNLKNQFTTFVKFNKINKFEAHTFGQFVLIWGTFAHII